MEPLYGKSGQPTAWIQWRPQAIYSPDGTCVGWLYGDAIFDVRGQQVGWSRGDHILDQRGAIVGVLAGARILGVHLPQPGPRHREPAARAPLLTPAFRRRASRPWPRTVWSKNGILESIGQRSVRPTAQDRLGRLRRWLGDLDRPKTF
jgi:hypothetical protein